eukprot:5315496-Amphidinium_carterae.1
MAKGNRKKPAAAGWVVRQKPAVVCSRCAATAYKKPSTSVGKAGKNSEIERARVLTAVEEHWVNLLSARDIWKRDHEIVLTAVQQDGWAFQYAAESCK